MLDQLNASLAFLISQTQKNAYILLIILLIPSVILMISQCTKHHLLILGITPRRLYGLPGILCAPLLHANVNHLFFNSIPLVVLSNFLLIHGLNYFLIVTISITFQSGFLIWCFAKPGLHMGASAVITGYWALLVTDMYHQGTLTAVLLGMVSLYYFAGIFLGVFPGKKGVSWEGHLFGLIAGVVTGYII